MNALPYIVNEQSIAVFIDGVPKTVYRENNSYKAIVNAIQAKDWTEVEELIDVATSIVKFGEGNLKVLDGEIAYKGEVVHNVMTNRILKMIGDGFDSKPMLRFLDNLMDNPSFTARQELYLFLEANTIPITEDGFFLAYKKVNSDYKDIHSGSFDNSVGSEPSMDRGEVDDDRDRTCSRGLHFCSFDYLDHFGSYYGSNGKDHVMIVKINPKDVVSIPSDYNNAKGRACRYKVVQEYTEWRKKTKVEYFDESVYSSDGGAYEKGYEDGKADADEVAYAEGFEDGHYNDDNLY
jgi:hypothetical protein